MNNFKFDLNDENILNVYQYGSRVYQSHTENSDYDYIIVVKEHFDSKDIDYHIYTEESFKMAIYEHDISALECLFLKDEFILKNTVDFKSEFKLNKEKLRTSISTIVNNSYVKCKKKLIVAGDYDLNCGIKSFYHSFRILNYGVQIALKGYIYDYACCNWLLNELRTLSKQYQRNELWNIIETRYKEIHKNKKSAFKELCPKNNNKLNIQILNQWLKNNNLSIMDEKQYNKFLSEIINKYF